MKANYFLLEKKAMGLINSVKNYYASLISVPKANVYISDTVTALLNQVCRMSRYGDEEPILNTDYTVSLILAIKDIEELRAKTHDQNIYFRHSLYVMEYLCKKALELIQTDMSNV